MSGIKSFINKVKEKNTQFQANQKEKQAQAKGFSNRQSYDFYSSAAKTQGEESAKKQLRKKELKRIHDEAQENLLLGRSGKYNKFQNKVQKGFTSFNKGVGVYNEVMGEFKSMSSGNDSFYPKQNTNQAYASGYGIFNQPKRRKSSKKKSKTKRRSKGKKQGDFWDQFMQY